MRTPPTQRDIARALNLSQTSVAFALDPKHQDRLPPETVALIQAKAEEMRYQPRRIAKMLRSGRSHTIAVVMVSANLKAPQERVQFLAQCAIQAGYQLVAIDLDWFKRDEAAARQYLLDSTAEGVVFCNVNSKEGSAWLDLLRDRAMPFIHLSSVGFEAGDRVHADIAEAYLRMTEHHLEMGARRPLLLLSARDPGYTGAFSASITDRVDGFARAILAAGGKLTADDFPVSRFFPGKKPSNRTAKRDLVGQIVHSERRPPVRDAFEMGYAQADRFIREKREFDALICSNDELASGAMAACMHHGVPVPEKVRISGGDNARYSRFGAVPLTTIVQPSLEMVEWSVRRIVELIENAGSPQKYQHRVFPCKLICRQSTTGLRTPEASIPL
ncbi:MAG TPA: LacI family DNA-binding transcriptional regulator [Chthoniobacteraceae bacterium]|nr:LacI family DNA-binding transcriptional regulator [Chthoniobacteraceae bacterium]